MSDNFLGIYKVEIVTPFQRRLGKISLFKQNGIINGEIEVTEGKSEFSGIEFVDNTFSITYDSNIPMPAEQTLNAEINGDKITGSIVISIKDKFTAQMEFFGSKETGV